MGFERVKVLLSTAHFVTPRGGTRRKYKPSSAPQGSLENRMEDGSPVGPKGEDTLETKPTASGALSPWGPCKREP